MTEGGTNSRGVTSHIEEMRKLLLAGDGPAASRRFAELVSDGTVPRGLSLPDWLRRAIGQDYFNSLILEYSRKACPLCERGLQTCSECSGSGNSPEGGRCRRCLTLGHVPCEFCDGSGLAAYSFAPDQLRPFVLAARVSMAASRARRMTADPPVADVPALHQALLEVVNLNKLLAVLENAAIELDFQAKGSLLTRLQYVHIRKSICEQAMLVEKMVRDSLHAAGRSSMRGNSGNRPGPHDTYYGRLAASAAFSGTFLEHPFLRRMLESVAQPGAGAAGSHGQDSSNGHSGPNPAHPVDGM